jgi:hypothetical protein
MKLDRLSDEIGDHGEEPHVGIEPKHRLAVPHPVDGQRSHHLHIRADRNADEGDSRTIFGGAAGSNKGLSAMLCTTSGIAVAMIWPTAFSGRPELSRRRLAPAGADHNVGRAVIIEQRDDTVPHLHERRQQIEHVRERYLEAGRRSEYLRDLVDAGEGNLAQCRRLTVDPTRCEVSVKHGIRSNVLGAYS